MKLHQFRTLVVFLAALGMAFAAPTLINPTQITGTAVTTVSSSVSGLTLTKTGSAVALGGSVSGGSGAPWVPIALNNATSAKAATLGTMASGDKAIVYIVGGKDNDLLTDYIVIENNAGSPIFHWERHGNPNGNAIQATINEFYINNSSGAWTLYLYGPSGIVLNGAIQITFVKSGVTSYFTGPVNFSGPDNGATLVFDSDTTSGISKPTYYVDQNGSLYSGPRQLGIPQGGTTGQALVKSSATDGAVNWASLAPLASPTFTGTPAAPTPTGTDNSTTLATTAYVKGQGYATLASPALTGTPTSTTPATSDNTTNIATTAYVKAQGYATLASPTFTGTPVAPTATAGTNTTQLATTAFVATSYAPLASPTLTGTPAAPTAAFTTNSTQLATTAFAKSLGPITTTGSAITLTATAQTLVTYTLPSTGTYKVEVFGALNTTAAGTSANAVLTLNMLGTAQTALTLANSATGLAEFYAAGIVNYASSTSGLTIMQGAASSAFTTSATPAMAVLNLGYAPTASVTGVLSITGQLSTASGTTASTTNTRIVVTKLN